MIERAPNVQRKLALSSPVETIVYLHKGFEQRQAAEGRLELAGLDLPDGPVSVRVVHPNSGQRSVSRSETAGGALTLKLPAFHENLAISIQRR